MHQYERHKRILALLKGHEFLTNKNLLRELNCSRATLQRDLEYLESIQQIKRERGGIVPFKKIERKENPPEFQYFVRKKYNLQEKDSIGRAVQKIIQNDDVVFLSQGTTISYVASNISPEKNITVVTNGLDVIKHLETKNNVKVLVLGGIIDYEQQQIVGPVNSSLMDKLHISKMIIGAGGITIEKGITFYDFLSVEFLSFIAKYVDEIVVAVDYSKIGRNAFVQFKPLSQISTIITDEKADRIFVEKCKNEGVSVII